MSDDDPFAPVPEVAIEECVTDLVEHFWDNMSNDDEFVDEKIEDLAAILGIDPEAENAIERYQELYGRIVRASWAGLIGKLGDQLLQVMQQDLDGDFG